jgi:hypothetical protein
VIDNQDSDYIDADDETAEDYSEIEVMWVGSSSHGLYAGSGIDTRTRETVEWVGDARHMQTLKEAVEASEDVVYALVPYWAERFRKAHASS